jgi:hypothetical protein
MISIPPVSYGITIVSVPWLVWGVVAFTIKGFRVPKNDPRNLLASNEYPKYVENHPLVFGTLTLAPEEINNRAQRLCEEPRRDG